MTITNAEVSDMKILLSWPYAVGEEDDAPDCIVVLVPSKQLFKRMLAFMRKAEKLETQIDGFIQMDIQDWNPLFIDTDKLLDVAEGLDTGFNEVEVSFTKAELEKLAEESRDARIESCVAFVEKERVGWEFYVKHWDVPCYTGTLDREYVEKQL
jgi:hypothetical protein